MTNSENANVLMHHGILGQKWGVRRFQDKSGKLTKAGKKRYSEKAQDLSDEELNKRINRMRKENEYNQLSKGQLTRGQNFVENIAIATAATVTTGVIVKVGQKYAEGLANVVAGKLVSKTVDVGKNVGSKVAEKAAERAFKKSVKWVL